MSDNIKAFSLLNGREIMAVIVSEDETHYDLVNAMGVTFSLTQDVKGQSTIQIDTQPISFAGEHNERGISIRLPKHTVQFDPIEPNADILAWYNSLKSPIQLITPVSRGGFTRN
jgi:hypothetical protein